MKSCQYLPFRRPPQESYQSSSSSWNVIRRLHRHRRRYPMMMIGYQIPLFVAVGTAFTTLISELRKGWNYELPRNVIPSYTATTTVRAFTFQTQKRRVLLDWGGIQTQRSVADMPQWSSHQNCYRYAPFRTTSQRNGGDVYQFNTMSLRAFSDINNKNDGEESWEQDIDDDDTGGDDDDDDVDETLLSTLENDNNESYDVEDDDQDDIDDVDDIDTVVDQMTENDTDASGDPLVDEYERWSVAVNKAIAALEKKRFSLEKEFVKAEQLESLQTRGQYLQSYRHMFTNQVQSVTVQDWDTGEDIVLTLDTNQYHSVGDEIDAIYTETKKLKRGKKVVATLLEQTVQAIDSMKGMKIDLDAVLEPTFTTEPPQMDSSLLQFIQDRLVTSASVTNFKAPIRRSVNEAATTNNINNTGSRKKSNVASKPVLGTPSSNIRKVITPAGCTILVGRNRRGNEHLSLHLAQKQDIWMHARDRPGAHVLVVQRGRDCATDACFQLAADLAAFYSDGRSERKVAVSAAEPKHIQKPRGAPLGAVKVREELRVYSGRPEAVPEELKDARAISGLSNEYRIQDKSKLRKQNQQQVAEQKLVTKRKFKEKSDRQRQDEADKFY